MKHLAMILLAAALLQASPLLAHGDREHVMGNVTSVTDVRIEVETAEGQSVSIQLNEATRYSNIEGVKTDARPVVGQPVAVDVEKSSTLTATEVRFATGNGHGAPRIITPLTEGQ